MKSAVPAEYTKQRASFRLPMVAAEPVYLLFSLEGTNIDPIVDELGAGGARFVTAKHFDKFYKGRVLGPAVVVLPDVGMPVVYPVVRWMSHPRIGIQFNDIDDKNREMIFRFMFHLERRMVQMQKANTPEDRIT